MTTVEATPVERTATLHELNQQSIKFASERNAYRDETVGLLMAIISERHGEAAATHASRYLADIIAGKPTIGFKPKMLRVPVVK